MTWQKEKGARRIIGCSRISWCNLCWWQKEKEERKSFRGTKFSSIRFVSIQFKPVWSSLTRFKILFTIFETHAVNFRAIFFIFNAHFFVHLHLDQFYFRWLKIKKWCGINYLDNAIFQPSKLKLVLTFLKHGHQAAVHQHYKLKEIIHRDYHPLQKFQVHQPLPVHFRSICQVIFIHRIMPPARHVIILIQN